MGAPMCFSAAASFSAGAVCAGVGSMAVRRASKPDLMLAFIPVIFALHQTLEGVVWATHGEGWGRYAGYAFAIVAFCLWPIYVPVAAWMSESDPRRRKLILFFIALGGVMVALGAQALYSGLTIDFATHQIRYLPIMRYPLAFDYVYASCAAAPFLLHRNVYLKVFGCSILVFFVVSIFFFNPARYSVWCFFAALGSAVVYRFVASSGARQWRPASE